MNQEQLIEHLKALKAGHTVERERSMELFYKHDACVTMADELLAKAQAEVPAEAESKT